MHGVRSVGNLIFFLVLISVFLFSGVYADQTINIPDPATPGPVKGASNQSEHVQVILTPVSPAPESMVNETNPADKPSLQAVQETTIPAPPETPVIIDTTTTPTPEPTIIIKNTLNETGAAHSRATLQEQANTPGNAPANPAFLEYQNRTRQSPGKKSTTVVFNDGSASRVFLEGYIPAPVDLSYTRGEQVRTDTGGLSAGSSYPSSYDIRSSGKVSPVKNQGFAGSCWAFATIASLESTLLPGENWDFSENNMKNTLADTYPDGFDRAWDGGGNQFMSAAYLTRWSGPVLESDDPYSDTSGTSPEGLYSYKHVQNAYFLPERSNSTDNNNIKDALINRGAVQALIYWDNSYYSDTNFAFYNDGSRIGIDPYQIDSTSINHAITIVGWDDSYSSTKFATPPAGNGAFIVKNSWGPGWGDSGYFYISYYDLTIGDQCAVFTGEPVTNYDRVYSYDPLGWINSLGYRTSSAQFANVFTAQSRETLNAIGMYETYPGSYTARIYLDPVGGPINVSGYVAQTSWSDSLLGYRTIDVPDISLKPGQKYSVVVSASTPGYHYPIPIESPEAYYSSHATANAGESYISKNGATWTDMTRVISNTNVCLKGYTTLQTMPGITPSQPYNQYISMWNHGVSAITELPNSGVSSVTDAGWGHRTVLNKAPVLSPAYTWARVDCPLMTIASFSGRHAYIRYGTIRYRTESSLGSKIMRIDFYSGGTFVRSNAFNAYSSPDGSWQELTWDLGAYYDFVRGMNMALLIENHNTTAAQYLDVSGYGAKGEFNA